MKAKDLIKQLEKIDPDEEIYLEDRLYGAEIADVVLSRQIQAYNRETQQYDTITITLIV